MNNKQEKIAENLINLLKKHNGSIGSLSDEIGILFPMRKSVKTKHIVFGALRERNLIKDFPGGAIGLTEKGWKFESFEKIEREESIQYELAESNIRANELNEKNSKYIKIGFIVNLIFAIINVLIAIL